MMEGSMKILHIGKNGNVNRFSKDEDKITPYTLIELAGGLSDEEYLKEARDCDFIISDPMCKVSANIIDSMPHLKMIHTEGVGYNLIDIEMAKKKNVYVCNSKGVNATAVAEQTLLLILGVLRDVKANDKAVKSAQQIQVKENYMKEASLPEIADLKIGLIGFGDIAKATSKLLNAFNADLYYYSHHRLEPSIEKEFNIKYLEKEELIKTCDLISLHTPVTSETFHGVNDEFFNLMKDGSYLVNSSRGELVDTDALIRALKSGKLKMAGLDTIEGEPVQKDNKLINCEQEILDKLLLSPHIAGITGSSFRRAYHMIWQDIQRVMKHERPHNIVNGL